MQAASRVLDAQAEVEALKKQLAEAHGPEGAASRQELEQDLAKVVLLSRRESETIARSDRCRQPRR